MCGFGYGLDVVLVIECGGWWYFVDEGGIVEWINVGWCYWIGMVWMVMLVYIVNKILIIF